MHRRLIIISGGQSGVDRAALDTAIACGMRYGGWCPRGGWAEDFPKPPGVLARYPLLQETPSAAPAQRTEWNVRDSDASLILVEPGGVAVSGGTALAERLSAQYERPLLVVNVGAPDAVERITIWLSALLAVRSPDAVDSPDATPLPAYTADPVPPLDTPCPAEVADSDAGRSPDTPFRLAIGGPRESEAPGIYEKARAVIEEVVGRLVKAGS